MTKRFQLVSSIKACAMAVVFVAVADTAQAQLFEFEVGGGHVFRGVPAVTVAEIGGAVWPAEHWGVAARFVQGLGDDVSNPVRVDDRTFLGTRDLKAWMLTARYRSRTMGLEFGVGIADRRYRSLQIWHFREPAEPHEVSEADAALGGITFEALYKRTILRHLAIKAGVVYDEWIDGVNYVRPVVLATIGR